MLVKYKPWALKNENGDLWGVELLEGEFAGTTISIASLQMEDNSDGTLALDFTIVKKANGKTDVDYQSDKFNGTLERVVNNILEKAIDEFENRDSDSAESSQ
jgi:hypothetical protein